MPEKDVLHIPGWTSEEFSKFHNVKSPEDHCYLCKREHGSTTYAYEYDLSANYPHDLIVKRVVGSCGKDIFCLNICVECISLLEAFSGRNPNIQLRGDDRRIKDVLDEKDEPPVFDPDSAPF